MDKSPDAFRTISEVAELLETPAHVLRFWESRFPQIKPVKRAGGRRYYRPADLALLTGIRRLLHDEGLTIRGVQKILREQGVRHVSGLTEEESEAPFEADDTFDNEAAEWPALSSDPIPLFPKVHVDLPAPDPEGIATAAGIQSDDLGPLLADDVVFATTSPNDAPAIDPIPEPLPEPLTPPEPGNAFPDEDPATDIIPSFDTPAPFADPEATGFVTPTDAEDQIENWPEENWPASELTDDADIAQDENEAAMDIEPALSEGPPDGPVFETLPEVAAESHNAPPENPKPDTDRFEQQDLPWTLPAETPTPASIQDAPVLATPEGLPPKPPQPQIPMPNPLEITGHWMPADLRALRKDALRGKSDKAAAIFQRLEALRNRVGDRGRVPRR